MSEQYKRELLRIACAQICQTIGYNATTTSSLEILQDLLQRFILEFSKNLRRHVELCNRTAPTLSDVELTLSSLNINISELQDYVGNVEPVAFVLDVPKFPAAKAINLNFLKPGSKEVLTRPVHVFDHLPPMLPCEENYAVAASQAENSKHTNPNCENSGNEPDLDSSAFPANNILATLTPVSKMHDERATREISSVVMTTGGFISPAIEGKMPEAGMPAIIEKFLGLDAPPPPTPPPPPPDLEIATSEKLPELEKLPKPSTDIKEPKIPMNIEPSQLQPIIRKNLKSHLNENPNALKHLKKTKKKNAPAGSMPATNMSSLSLEDLLNLNVERLNEKGRRKRLKLLQKHLKNSQNHQDLDNAKSMALSAYVSNLPPGLERLTLEKLLKKQAKQKQKLLKKRKQNPIDLMQSNPVSEAIERHITEVHKKVPNEIAKMLKGFEPLGVQQLNYETNQTSCNVESTAPSLEMQKTSESVSRNVTTPIDLKLSNEPDRSKLNIFKKISKAQKVSQINTDQTPPVPPTVPIGLFTGSEGEIINLPTGTTITPAPLIFNTPFGQESGNVLQAPPNVIANMPKKRGRKPGSKNQPKPPNIQSGALGLTNPGIIGKKTKKAKQLKNLCAQDNLNAFAIDKQLTVTTLQHSPNKIPPQHLSPVTLPVSLKPIPRKERKEKAEKNKLITESQSNMQNFSKPTLDHSIRDIKAEPFGVGSVHIKPIDLLLNEPNQEHLLNTKVKKRSPYQNQSQKKQTQPQPNLLSTFPPPGFPTLAQNILPMFPFSFPPRPGLIPAPGLFAAGAPGLTSFQNQPSILPGSTGSNMANPALMGLAAQMFPYASSNSFPNQNIKERIRDPPTSTNEQRSYCNVAPLVPPETIKLVGNSGSLKSSKQRVETTNAHVSPTNLVSKNCAEEALTAKLAQTGNIGDPIEVSDDSDETTLPVSIKPFDKSINSDLLAKPATNALYLSPPSATLPSATVSATGKKPKKLQKISSFPQTDPAVDMLTLGSEGVRQNFDGGFGKLAGGADLIPLSNAVSGSAYSAKSIPATSLTASSRQISPTSLSSQPIFDSNHTTNAPAIFNDLTITPTTTSAPPEISVKKKNKERKKLRKVKDGTDGKIKKKKDKKEKMKEKERAGMLFNEDKKSHNQKESLKKLKKEKKKEKQRLKETIKTNPEQSLESSLQTKVSAEATTSFLSQLNEIVTTPTPTVPFVSSISPPSLPKITLKIGTGCQSPVPGSISKTSDVEHVRINQKTSSEREPSPELARFSPLVTRPPKQKVPLQNDNLSGDISSECNKTAEGSLLNASQHPPKEQQQSLLPPPSPWLSGSTLTASSVLLPQQLMSSSPLSSSSPKLKLKADQPQRHALSKNASEINVSAPSTTPAASNDPVPLIKETNRPSSYVDAEGNTVWICPACGKVDDGSPMIGCDGCDAWYHWECVGIAVAPKDNEDWFCRVCITRKKGFHGNNDGVDKKRKRNKKKVV